MRKLNLLVLPLIFALCNCRAAPPRIEVVGALGSARSEDASVARMLATTGSILAPQVSRLLQVEAEPPFVIWHMPEMHDGGLFVERNFTGAIMDRRIGIGDFLLQAQPQFTVAHELVHWYATGIWDRLPHAVEEGVADTIALRFVPEWKQVRESELAMNLLAVTPARRSRALEVTERTWQSSPMELRFDAYAVGFEIAHRIGIDGLHGLCERAAALDLERIPVAWLEAPVGSAQNPLPWKIRVPLQSASQ
ncbi:MAG TPA: hypothetical protein VK843_00460 [Planctomycetota bacterium]|nr:hypothetical protein [Planctomycetota bacterium]